MSNFEKRFGKYAIRNLSLVLILCYAFGYLIRLVNPAFVDFLTLNPYLILRGQIWRLVTWILVPPQSLDIFTLIMLYFYYSIGTTLERTWGTYRYNLYIFSGMLFTIAGSFVSMALCYLMFGDLFAAGLLTPAQTFAAGGTFFSTYYINMSIFLAFAATFPDVQVLLMFVIPVKMKIMGILYAVLLAAQFISGTGSSLGNLFLRVAIVASLMNFVVFWFSMRSHMHLSPKQIRRRQEFRQEVKRGEKMSPTASRHKCAICGRTPEDDPSLEFRYCSKCEGSYEYCQYHLFTHEHVKRSH